MISREHLEEGFKPSWKLDLDLVEALHNQLERLERDVAKIRSTLNTLIEENEAAALDPVAEADRQLVAARKPVPVQEGVLDSTFL